jgi:hypothetical protein
MSEDIVARLRKSTWRDCVESSNEIEKLRERILDLEAMQKGLYAEVVCLRSGLKDIADNEYNEPLSAEFARDVLKGPHAQ